ncbi:CpsD/CapB family tyrosine-protein kinase [Cohnella lupini]|uniref:non-specific protein-tyrosine kinase n=1 Tax=Cohnella lupini TaxID=1294267 RepID=A0A3D9IVS0_9BACL|nr:CpsD/CapB family tyrosine-protein kinase [Cohnella lupini]RED65812.1 capsular exopolysaccharide synthesis family protein [Cohnella lupini]
MSKLSPEKKKRHIIVHNNPKSPISEAYRSLRTNIQFSSSDAKVQIIMVTSANPGEGKSTTASNLAVTYAQANQKVLMIDADLRKPTAHHTFLASNRNGLSNVLSNQCQLSEVIVDTFVPNLSLLPSGITPPNPAELLGSNKMKVLLSDLRDQFDMIIVDTPPALAVTDSQIIASICDGVILVVDSGRVKHAQAQKARDKLTHVNARMLGVVMNNVRHGNKDEYYYYYGASE